MWVSAQVSPSGCEMLYRCGRAGGVTALWFVQRMLQGSREKKEKEIHSSACKSVKPSEPVLSTTGFCPVETEICKYRTKQDFHLWHYKKKKSKKPAAFSQLFWSFPVVWAAKADCRLLTVVATAIFEIAICNWLINASWVQTVLLIKLRGTFQKQYWWVLHCAGRAGHGCLSPPERGKTNKQGKYRPEQNGS